MVMQLVAQLIAYMLESQAHDETVCQVGARQKAMGLSFLDLRLV